MIDMTHLSPDDFEITGASRFWFNSGRRSHRRDLSGACRSNLARPGSCVGQPPVQLLDKVFDCDMACQLAASLVMVMIDAR